MDEIKKLIREVPDYPKLGILFYDLTTVLKDKQGFRNLVDHQAGQRGQTRGLIMHDKTCHRALLLQRHVAVVLHQIRQPLPKSVSVSGLVH